MIWVKVAKMLIESQLWTMLAEVALAGQEQRHKLVLEGEGVQERAEKGELVNIFKLDKLDKLNFLQTSQVFSLGFRLELGD
jgi:hypothetical protein